MPYIAIQSNGYIEEINRVLSTIPPSDMTGRDRNYGLERIVSDSVKIAGYAPNRIGDEFRRYADDLNYYLIGYDKNSVHLLLSTIDRFIGYLNNLFLTLGLYDSEGVCPYRFIDWLTPLATDILLYSP